MSLEQDLYAGVKGQAAIAAALGGADAPRWYYGLAPQEGPRAYPYVTATLVQPPSTHHMGGVAAIDEATLQLDFWGENPSAARILARQVDAWLDGFRGTMGSSRIRRIFRQSLTDLPVLRADGGELQTFRIRGEWRIVYAP